MTHDEMLQRFPKGMRVQLTALGAARFKSIVRHGGRGIVVGYTARFAHHVALKVLVDGYKLSTAHCNPMGPDNWEPLGEIVERSRWIPAIVERDGLVALHVEINIDATSIGSWPPERIAALFDGLAKVKAATDGPAEKGHP